MSGCVRDAVAEWAPLIVRVDLRAATFFDSTGLGALIEGYRATTEIKSRFLVVEPTPALRRALDVTGLAIVRPRRARGGRTAEPTQATGA